MSKTTKKRYTQKEWAMSFIIAFIIIAVVTFGFLYLQALLLRNAFKNIKSINSQGYVKA